MFLWNVFLFSGHKVNLVPRAGQTNPFFDPPVAKKSYARHKNNFFSLVAHDFFSTGGSKNGFSIQLL